jgi:hypothetical protein
VRGSTTVPYPTCDAEVVLTARQESALIGARATLASTLEHFIDAATDDRLSLRYWWLWMEVDELTHAFPLVFGPDGVVDGYVLEDPLVALAEGC